MADRTNVATRLLEGLTIVLSILAAFMLDSWWDDHLAARALDEGLTAVVEELDLAEKHVAERVEAYSRVEGYLVTILDLLGTERGDSVIEIPDTLMPAILYTPTIDPPTGALDAFFRAGLLASVADPEVRNRLAALPSQYADGEDDERDALEYTLATVRPMLERSLSAQDFAAVMGQTQHYWSLFRASSPWNTPVSNVRLQATFELHNAIASRLQMLRTSQYEVRSLGREIAATAKMLHEASP